MRLAAASVVWTTASSSVPELRAPAWGTARTSASWDFTAPGLGGGDGVFQQAGDGHWADAAGYRGDGAGMADHFVEGDIAGQGSGFGAVDADIDHNGGARHPVAAHHAGAADGGDQHFGAAAFDGEVVGAGMGQGYRGVGRG